MSKKRPLDAVDVAILKALQQDASMTNQAIGELVGLTPGPTHSRIKRMKEEGIIKGIHADLDWRSLGYKMFYCMDVKVESDKVEEAGYILTQVPNLWNVCKMIDPTNDREVTFRDVVCDRFLRDHACHHGASVETVRWLLRRAGAGCGHAFPEPGRGECGAGVAQRGFAPLDPAEAGLIPAAVTCPGSR